MTEGNRIVALVDASLYARSVCDHAAWMAVRTGLPVELVHVMGRREATQAQDLSGAIALGARSSLLQELSSLDAERSRLAHEHGRAILDDAREILAEKGVTATASLRRGDLVENILARGAEAEFVVIGKRGEAADFAKGHLGSNLERVVRASDRPILVASRSFQPIEKILVAFDGGSSALRAVDQLARAPLYRGLSVTVVTVGSSSAAIEKGLSDAAATLQAGGIDAQSRILPGRPESTLGELVEAERFDVVVMGAYGHSRIRSLMIGSTTTEMIRSCRVPIMLVR